MRRKQSSHQFKEIDKETANELLQDHKLIIERIKVLKFVLGNPNKIKENIVEIRERIKGYIKKEKMFLSYIRKEQGNKSVAS